MTEGAIERKRQKKKSNKQSNKKVQRWKLSFNALMQPQLQEIILPFRIHRKRSKIESIGFSNPIYNWINAEAQQTNNNKLVDHVCVFFCM